MRENNVYRLRDGLSFCVDDRSVIKFCYQIVDCLHGFFFILSFSPTIPFDADLERALSVKTIYGERGFSVI